MTGGWVYRQGALADKGGYQDVATPNVYIYPKCDPASIDLPEEEKLTADVKKQASWLQPVKILCSTSAVICSAVVERRSRETQ